MVPFMKTGNLIRTLLFFIFSLAAQWSLGQACTTSAPASGSCSGTQMTNGNTYNVYSGSYYYSASGGTISIGQISGGTMMICGNVTISSFSGFYSGSVIIEPGGSLTIGTSSSNVNLTLDGGSIANYGTFTINGTLALDNGSEIWNLPSSQGFAVAGSSNSLKLEGGYFVNSANTSVVTVPTLFLQGGAGSLCMGDLAIINADSLYNTTTNSVAYSGTISSACIGISVGSNLTNTSLTGSSMISVCLASGERQHNSNWGSAIVSTNCSGCNIALPLNITGFTATALPGSIKLAWSSGDLSGSEIFEVQKSDNAKDFYPIASIPAAENQNQYIAYDYAITQNIQYYRIKETNSSGNIIYSVIQSVNTDFIHGTATLSVYPNPVGTAHSLSILINSNKEEDAIISLIDIAGRLLQVNNSALAIGNNQLQLNLKNIPAGIYILKVQTATLGFEFRRVSVVNSME
jgi:hypothetical protein